MVLSLFKCVLCIFEQQNSDIGVLHLARGKESTQNCSRKLPFTRISQVTFHASLVSSYHFVFMGGARTFLLMFSYILHVISFTSMVVGSIWLDLAFRNK